MKAGMIAVAAVAVLSAGYLFVQWSDREACKTAWVGAIDAAGSMAKLARDAGAADDFQGMCDARYLYQRVALRLPGLERKCPGVVSQSTKRTIESAGRTGVEECTAKGWELNPSSPLIAGAAAFGATE